MHRTHHRICSESMQCNPPLRSRWNLLHPYPISDSECPWIPPTQYYSYAPNYDCRSTCPSNYYAFNGNLSCLATCPSAPNMTYYDHVNNKCVTKCPDNFFSAANRSCLACTCVYIQLVLLGLGVIRLSGLV